jgi:hypothetical protein
MTDLILQTAALVSLFCGMISGTFATMVYVTIRRLGGNLERRHVLVLTSVTLLFFAGAVVFFYLGSTV